MRKVTFFPKYVPLQRFFYIALRQLTFILTGKEDDEYSSCIMYTRMMGSKVTAMD